MGLGVRVRVGVWVRVRVSVREHARHLLSFESRPRNAHLRRGRGSKAARVDGRRRGRLAKLLLHEAPRVTDVPVRGLGVAFGGLGVAFGGLAGGFEGAGATAQEERRRAGPWLRRGAAAGEGGRRVNRLERTRSPDRRALPVRSAAVPSHACPACPPAPPARASGARCLGRRAARARRAAVPSARRPPAPTGLGLGSGLGSGLGLGLGVRD